MREKHQYDKGSNRPFARWVFALIPWFASLFLQRWLEQQSVWDAEMPMRSGLSLCILGMGLVGSFSLNELLLRRGW